MANANKKIIIIDDDIRMLDTCKCSLSWTPVQCRTFSSPVKALDVASKIKPAIILSDQRMQHIFGINLIRRIRIENTDAIGIIMIGNADVSPLVSTVTRGDIFSFIQ